MLFGVAYSVTNPLHAQVSHLGKPLIKH